MQQKEIHLVNLDPVIDNEQSGIRPVVVISGDALNEHFKMAIVCPLSGSIKNYPGCPIIEPDSENGLTKPSEVLTFQVKSVAISRSIKKLGEINDKNLQEIIVGLNKILYY